MPLRWEILHPQKFIRIVAEGPVTLKEMEEHFDAIAVENAMSYAKLFDATLIEPKYDDHDVLMMGARLSASSNGPAFSTTADSPARIK